MCIYRPISICYRPTLHMNFFNLYSCIGLVDRERKAVYSGHVPLPSILTLKSTARSAARLYVLWCAAEEASQVGWRRPHGFARRCLGGCFRGKGRSPCCLANSYLCGEARFKIPLVYDRRLLEVNLKRFRHCLKTPANR